MSGVEGIDGPPRWREGDPVWVTFGPDAEPQRAWVREGGSLFMDHVPVRIEEGDQDAVVRSDHVARRFAAPQPERRPNVFKAEARFLLSGAELEEIVFEIAGAVSAVFLSEDPHKVMPATEVTKAVHDWYAATEGTFTEAEARAQLDLLDKPDPALVPIPDEFPSFEGSEQVKAWADSNVALASVFTRRMIEAGVHSPQEARVWGQAADMLSAEFERLAPQEWKDEATAAGFPPVEPGPPEPPIPPPDRWNPGQDSYYGYGWEDLTPVQKWSLGLILAIAAVVVALTLFGK